MKQAITQNYFGINYHEFAISGLELTFRETEKNVQSLVKSKNPFAQNEQPKIKYKQINSKSVEVTLKSIDFERHEIVEIDEDQSIFFQSACDMEQERPVLQEFKVLNNVFLAEMHE